MAYRNLIRDAAPRLQPGDEVVTPSGRRAFVEAIDPQRGEVVVRWPAELGVFRPQWLRHADRRDGGGIVFLDLGSADPEQPAEPAATTTAEGA